jgi:hypothetical protein
VNPFEDRFDVPEHPTFGGSGKPPASDEPQVRPIVTLTEPDAEQQSVKVVRPAQRTVLPAHAGMGPPRAGRTGPAASAPRPLLPVESIPLVAHHGGCVGRIRNDQVTRSSSLVHGCRPGIPGRDGGVASGCRWLGASHPPVDEAAGGFRVPLTGAMKSSAGDEPHLRPFARFSVRRGERSLSSSDRTVTAVWCDTRRPLLSEVTQTGVERTKDDAKPTSQR